ncbi:MAG: FtsW/RodA/SpoVE family cell cycle protein [Flavobacteriaceae bacterium]|nr:FtsW/RodA/SpoVE family cell cycle protein [Flavobacteriaceae bacterium]
MSNKKLEQLKNIAQIILPRGDLILWICTLFLSITSIVYIFSASTNLEVINDEKTVIDHTRKHFLFILAGLLVMRLLLVIKYEYFGRLNKFLALPLFFALLIWAAVSGQEISGASASRWVKITEGVQIQPSVFIYLSLIIYICSYLASKKFQPKNFKAHFWQLFLPITVISGIILKDNGSTAGIILLVSIVVMILGQLSLKYISVFFGGTALLVLLYCSAALYTDWLPGSNRVHTWKSRIESFLKDGGNNYQAERAEAAIVHGGISGQGPGKSALKQVLPQSASDFIFAIIIEEYGLFGGSFIFLFYTIILVRIIMIARNTSSFFGSLLVLSIGVMLFVQLAINISVAIGIFPVTGQPLPLISYGGTSMLVTYVQLGIVLNISSRIQMRNEEGIGKKQKFEKITDIA